MDVDERRLKIKREIGELLNELQGDDEEYLIIIKKLIKAKITEEKSKATF